MVCILQRIMCIYISSVFCAFGSCAKVRLSGNSQLRSHKEVSAVIKFPEPLPLPVYGVADKVQHDAVLRNADSESEILLPNVNADENHSDQGGEGSEESIFIARDVIPPLPPPLFKFRETQPIPGWTRRRLKVSNKKLKEVFQERFDAIEKGNNQQVYKKLEAIDQKVNQLLFQSICNNYSKIGMEDKKEPLPNDTLFLEKKEKKNECKDRESSSDKITQVEASLVSKVRKVNPSDEIAAEEGIQ